MQPAGQKSFIDHVLEGAAEGAQRGVKCSGGAIVGIFGYVILGGFVEGGTRALGADPHYPLISGDCQLEQFADSTICKIEGDIAYFGVAATAAVVASGVLGGAIGAAVGAVRAATEAP